MLTIAHYDEIGLKGKNRLMFENRLAENIRIQTGKKAERMQGRILVEGKADLSKVFGVRYFAHAETCSPDIGSIKKTVLGLKLSGKTMKVITSRQDKAFPMTSQEVSSKVGEILFNKGWKGDMKSPDEKVFIEITRGNAFVYTKKIDAPGGLPVGVSGKVVSLFSGGIDSPVSSYMLMKRGASVVLAHVHPFNSPEKAKKSKIVGLAKKLREFCPSLRLYLVPYYHFSSAVLEMPEESGNVLFRRFIARVAEKIALKENAKAISTGSALGQVASQTLENLHAVQNSVNMPILRPLIGFDKSEIVQKAKEIGTYSLSLEKYRDCCSIISKKPLTRPNLDRVLYWESKIPIDEIVDDSLNDSEVIEIR